MKKFSMKFSIFLLVCMIGQTLFWPSSLLARQDRLSDDSKNRSLPQEVAAGLDYLLAMVGRPKAVFQTAPVKSLLDFTAKDQNGYRHVRPQRRSSGNGVYMQIGVKAPLERILQYVYNPAIPNYIVFPSVLRLCGWTAGSELVTSGVKLWDELDGLAKPMIFRGKEFEVNTPDSFSGAYYRYVNNRLIIMMKHGRGRVLISASKMEDRSDVGKKAVIIDDRNWNYFYSGINGLNLNLIGGMNTYMYDAESVIVYHQPDYTKPHAIVSLFKWLNAGWAGINVVESDHIYEGCTRFARGLKRVMESDALPDHAKFAAQVEYIHSLTDDQIDAKIKEYSHNFEKIAREHKQMAKSDFARIIANGGYGEVLNHEERIGILVLELLKQQIGKPALVKFELSKMTSEPVPRKVSPVSAFTPISKNPDVVPKVSLINDRNF